MTFLKIEYFKIVRWIPDLKIGRKIYKEKKEIILFLSFKKLASIGIYTYWGATGWGNYVHIFDTKTIIY